MSAPLAVGVIGCGEIASLFHLPILDRLPGCELVAIAEPDPERRAEAVRRIGGIEAYDSAEALLDHEGLDAIVVCSPTALHAEHAIAAFDRGHHVYLEKPVGISRHEGERVVEAWRRAGTVGAIGFNYRFSPPYARARRFLAEDAIGDPIEASTVFSIGPPSIPDWKHERARGGGALLDLASHHIDMTRFLFDVEVRSVRAEVESRETEDDSAMLELRLDGGVVVRSRFSLCSALEERFEIVGREGSLFVDRMRHRDVVVRAPGGAVARRARYATAAARYLWLQLRTPGREPSFLGALSRFVADARGGATTSPDLHDGLRSLEIVLAAEASSRSGALVELS